MLPYDNPLICPFCGGDYLHHEQIDIFNRNREDSIEGLTITIQSTACAISTNADNDNPSRRRDGIRSKLWCEGCQKYPIMTIVQHKGQTFITWE